jgi:hypothetical protein
MASRLIKIVNNKYSTSEKTKMNNHNPYKFQKITLPLGLLLALLCLVGLSRPTYAQDVNLYLPSIRSVGGTSDAPPPTETPTATATPTATSTPLPPFSLTPGAVIAQLPNPDQESGVRPTGGQCPSGTHLVHAADGLGVFIAADELLDDEAEETINDNDYRCVPDQTVADISCGAHGQPTVINGVAACACDTGYAGASCTVCAPGHAPDASGVCKAVEKPPAALIHGSNASLEVGSTMVLSATGPAGNRIDATWTLVQPAGVDSAGGAASFAETGCLFALGGDQSCQRTVTGVQVGFRAPAALTTGANVQTAQIEMRPAGGLDFTTTTVVIIGQGGIPITGNGDPAMAPVLDAMSSFMKQRCVGAGVLGVARYGFPLAIYGFGRMDGRAAADWPAECGDDLGKPLAATVTNETPMRVGSANKGITFGVLRWTLRERLKALDSDFALTAVADDRAVTASRLGNNTLRIAVWLVAKLGAADGNVVQLGTLDVGMYAKQIDLVAIDGARVAAIIRTPNNDLQFRLFTISNTGQVSAGSTFTIDQPDQKVVAFSTVRVLPQLNNNNRFAVIARQNDGDYHLRVVDVAGNNTFSVVGGFEVLGSTRDVVIADVSALLQQRVVVALRTDDNSLKLRTFNIAANGQLSSANEISAGAVQELSLAAVSASRVVAGVRMANGNLKLIVYDIDAGGALTRRGEDEAGAITQLTLAALTDRVVAATVRQSNGEFKLITWLVTAEGNLARAGDDAAGPINGLDLQRLSATRLLAGVRTQGNALKLIVWDAVSITTLQRRGDAEGGALLDYPWSEADVEALALTGYDFPERMLPHNLISVLSGSEQLPIAPIADSTAFGSLEGGHERCTTLTNKADPQWQQVLIGHLLAHRTGLQRSAPNLNYQVNHLAALRGLTSQADFAAQEALLRAEDGDLAVDQGKERLFYGDSTTLYVLPRPTLNEILMLVAARCLRYPLGEYHYSNTSPALGAAIIAHVRGTPFAAQLGYPAEHEGSALDQFFAQELGIETTANAGIFSSQRVLLDGAYQVREPVGRSWSGSTYYPQKWDAKRPHCVWNGSSCSFTDWLENPDQFGRLHWQWFVSPLVFGLTGDDTAWGSSGALATEPGVYLNYMRHRWIGGYDADPIIGAERNNVWSLSVSHNGSAGGAFGYGLHYSSDTATAFAVPYDPAGGYMADPAATDTFRAAEAAYFVANPGTGEVKRYNAQSQHTATIDLNLTLGNGFATGHSSIYPGKTAFYVARHNTGIVEVYGPTSTAFNTTFGTGFAAGDGFLVDDLLTEDVYDEVIIGDTSNGEVRVYNSQGFVLKTLALGFAAGDRLGVGDHQGDDGINELFIARAATGAVQVYSANGTPMLNLNAGYAPGDGFAVGDVVGTAQSADIVIASGATGMVSVYTYKDGAYTLLTTFNGYYSAGSSVILREPLNKTTDREIVVMSVYPFALRFQVDTNEEGEYEFLYQGGLPADFAIGDQLATAHNGGQRLYECALPDGTRQSFPDGVDVYVTVNQGSDKESVVTGGSSYYKVLPNVIKYGLCQVDWSEVVTTPPTGN